MKNSTESRDGYVQRNSSVSSAFSTIHRFQDNCTAPSCSENLQRQLKYFYLKKTFSCKEELIPQELDSVLFMTSWFADASSTFGFQLAVSLSFTGRKAFLQKSASTEETTEDSVFRNRTVANPEIVTRFNRSVSILNI